jgi:uncharacterized Zn finger protein
MTDSLRHPMIVCPFCTCVRHKVVRREVLSSGDILNVSRCDLCGHLLKYRVDRMGRVKD